MPVVVADAIQDFRHIPSWTNLAILAAGGLGAALEHPSDASVTRALSGSPRMGSFFRIGETVGGARTQLGSGAGNLRHRTDQRTAARSPSIGADLIQSQILAQTMTAAIKMGVGTDPTGRNAVLVSVRSFVGDLRDRDCAAA